MHSFVVWPALALLAGAAATIPMMENGSSRSIWYWWVLPTLAVGLAAMLSHTGLL